MLYPPLWKIWVRQLGWWHSQYMEIHVKKCSNHQPAMVLGSSNFKSPPHSSSKFLPRKWSTASGITCDFRFARDDPDCKGGTPQSHGFLFGPEMKWPQVGHPPWTNPWTPSVCWLSNSIYTPLHSTIPLFHTPWFIREITQIFWRPHDGNSGS